jgi:hypothetical protein
MEKDWIKIFHTGDLYRAELVKKVIEENGIKAVIMNQKDSSYLTFGEIEVLVKPEDVERAKKLIKELKF